VNTNGVLSFGTTFTSTSSGGRDFESVFSPPIIAPFWDDINIVDGGVIYYREVFDSLTVDLVRQEVASQFPEVGFFFPSLVFVATWDSVAQFGARNGLLNTFQTVIASDGARTFARFAYDDIQWGGRTLIGVSAGDRHSFVTHPASLSSSVVFLDDTNITYRVDRKCPLTEIRLLLTTLCLLQPAMQPHVNVFPKEISCPT
jgi:hypothetical protein